MRIRSTATDCSVLVIDGESTFAPAVVRCLGTVPGVRVHVLSARRLTPLRFSRAVASMNAWAGIEAPDAIDHIARLARRLDVDVCMAVDEPGIRKLGSAGDAIAVPCAPLPPVGSFDTTIDKWAFAQFMAAAGLPHPRTVLCSAATLEHELRDFPFPVLLKPRRGSNGRGILRFDDGNALLRHVVQERQVVDRHIVQNLVGGYDIDCSVLCDRGRVVAATVQRGLGTASGHFGPPGHVEFVDDPDVVAVVRGLMAALKWSGVAHVDLRRDTRTGRLVVLEVNPRFWGSLLGSLHAGVNFPWMACLSAIRRPFVAPGARECRYVSGAAATRQWLHGRLGPSRAGFDFSDTVFRYALSDPGPLFAELFL